MALTQSPEATASPTSVLENLKVASTTPQEMKGPATSGGRGGDSMKKIPANMEALKKEFPDMYKKFMVGIAFGICGKIKEQNDRLIELRREERRKNG